MKWIVAGSSFASSFIPHPSSFDLEEGTGVEPASDKCAVVFGTTALPVRLPFQEECRIANFGFALSSLLFAFVAMLAGTLGFEPRSSILEIDGLPVSLHLWIIFNCQLPIADLFVSRTLVAIETNRKLAIGNRQWTGCSATHAKSRSLC